MTSLRIVQTLTAGVDNIRAAVPDGVPLCNGRGIHDTSTAELALTLILSSLRGVPASCAPRTGSGTPGWRPALADKRCCSSGTARSGGRSRPGWCRSSPTVVRVARAARDGVHAIDELPALLPDADVVVLVVPLTDETRGLVDAAFLAG